MQNTTTWHRFHHFRSSRSRLSWNGRSDPHNFFNIANCQTIQCNYQIFFCASPHASSSSPQMPMTKSATGQPCEESVGTSVGSPLSDSSLTESSWSLPTCGESPGNKPTKSPELLSTSEPADIQFTIPAYLFNESTMELPPAGSGV